MGASALGLEADGGVDLVGVGDEAEGERAVIQPVGLRGGGRAGRRRGRIGEGGRRGGAAGVRCRRRREVWHAERALEGRRRGEEEGRRYQDREETPRAEGGGARRRKDRHEEAPGRRPKPSG